MTQIHDSLAQNPWSGIVRMGQTIRIIDSHGQQPIDTIFYDAADAGERCCSRNTMHENGLAHINTVSRIVSNEGRLMLTVAAEPRGATTRQRAAVPANPIPSAWGTRRAVSMPAARTSSPNWPATEWASATSCPASTSS